MQRWRDKRLFIKLIVISHILSVIVFAGVIGGRLFLYDYNPMDTTFGQHLLTALHPTNRAYHPVFYEPYYEAFMTAWREARALQVPVHIWVNLQTARASFDAAYFPNRLAHVLIPLWVYPAPPPPICALEENEHWAVDCTPAEDAAIIGWNLPPLESRECKNIGAGFWLCG
ncbi:MAG: hypothetical protein ACUVSX_06695 [Aggregatilineales bacterium]